MLNFFILFNSYFYTYETKRKSRLGTDNNEIIVGGGGGGGAASTSLRSTNHRP